MAGLNGVTLATQLRIRRNGSLLCGHRNHLLDNEHLATMFIDVIREATDIPISTLDDYISILFCTEHAVVVNHPEGIRAILNRHTGHLIVHSIVR